MTSTSEFAYFLEVYFLEVLRGFVVIDKAIKHWRFLLKSCVDTKGDDDDDDEGRINFSVALSPKTTRTRNNKLKQ